MTEADFHAKILAAWPTDGATSAATFALVEQALSEHPRSAALWCLRGVLIQLGAGEEPYDLPAVLASYQRAIEIDPTFAEAHEGIGYYHDDLFDDPRSAEPSFRAAVDCGGGEYAFVGLARVLAQLGRRDEALALLRPPSCPYATCDTVREIGDEIRDGLWEPDPA